METNLIFLTIASFVHVFLLCPTAVIALKPSFAASLAISRRDTIWNGVAVTFLSGGIFVAVPRFAMAATTPDDSIGVTAASLLDSIPRVEFDAPATNITLPSKVADRIEMMASSLEATYGQRRDYVASPQLAGSWRLRYSNGPEITSLAAKLPLGFALGPTYQPLDTVAGTFENRGSVLNRYGLARLQTNVVGDISVARRDSLNAVGIRNDRNNRVNVEFRCIVFQLDEVLGRPVSLRKVLIPMLDPGVEALPANDITYLDDKTRIVRGGDGALFVFERARLDDVTNKPMLTSDERHHLFLEGDEGKRAGDKNGAAAVLVGGKQEFSKDQPELNFLFQKGK